MQLKQQKKKKAGERADIENPNESMAVKFVRQPKYRGLKGSIGISIQPECIGHGAARRFVGATGNENG